MSVKDPVCGGQAHENTPFKAEFRGKKYLFCSSKCLAQFDKNPSQYSKKGK